MIDLIFLLSSFSIMFIIKDLSLFDKFRIYLFQNKYIGMFFYKMFSCPFCLGTHTSWIIYLLMFKFNFIYLICYTLAGASFNLITYSILIKINNN
jgi:hypothetical protein